MTYAAGVTEWSVVVFAVMAGGVVVGWVVTCGGFVSSSAVVDLVVVVVLSVTRLKKQNGFYHPQKSLLNIE